MKRVGVCGFGDKRAFIYALMNTLGQIERTMFITNNPMYRKLSENKSSDFSITGCRVIIVNDDYISVEDDIDMSDYVCIVYDVIDNAPVELDYVLILDELAYYEDILIGNNVMSEEDSPNVWRVKGMPKGTLPVVPYTSAEQFILKIEKDRVLYPVKIPSLMKQLTKTISVILEMSEKDIAKYIKRSKRLI